MKSKTKVNQRFSCFPQMNLQKKSGELMYEIIIHLILIGLIFALFFYVTAGRVNSKEVKQQVVEKEIALLIDSAEKGMSFSVNRLNMNGQINGLKIENGKVLALIDNLKFSKGYEYFSKYSVSVVEKEDRFVVNVR